MRHIPLLAEEGWLLHQKNAAKPQRRRRRARSASAIARSRNSGQFGWPFEGAAELTTPSATNRNGSIFLMSRTPLLCEEGNVRAEKLCPKNQKLQPCYPSRHSRNQKGELTAET